MYFAIVGRDRPGTQALRTQLRPAHREWLRRPGNHPITVLHGGPLLDAQGTMNGTLLIVQAPDLPSVQGFLAEDPYCRHQLFAQLEVRQWMWSLGAPQQPAGAT